MVFGKSLSDSHKRYAAPEEVLRLLGRVCKSICVANVSEVNSKSHTGPVMQAQPLVPSSEFLAPLDPARVLPFSVTRAGILVWHVEIGDNNNKG